MSIFIPKHAHTKAMNTKCEPGSDKGAHWFDQNALHWQFPVRGKSWLLSLSLALVMSSPSIGAGSGLDAYREGDYSLAAKLLQDTKAEPWATYYLGRMRLYGYGELKNNALALQHFEAAGQKGVLPSQKWLANYYLLEKKEPEKALDWFKKAASAGDKSAQLYCAAAFLYGYGTKKNEERAWRYYVDAAKQGSDIAQWALGEHFLAGRQPRNKKLGLAWLMKSVDQGNPKALFKLSQLQETGGIVKKDFSQARSNLEKSAQQNYAPALRKLAEINLAQSKMGEAQGWLVKAASENDPQAQFDLATLYLTPNQSLYEPKKGFMWMLQAAQGGHAQAQEKVASLYREGQGVEVSVNLADKWQKKAKETVALKGQVAAKEQVIQWLSNNKATDFNAAGYHLGGISQDWRNERALKENTYNASPQMKRLTRTEIYQPKFQMVSPDSVAMSDYFALIAPKMAQSNQAAVPAQVMPRYTLDSSIERLQKNDALVLNRLSNDAPLVIDEPRAFYVDNDAQGFNYFEDMTHGWERHAIYQRALTQLYEQAILGESNAQFEIGQLYHYGIIVSKNIVQAINYYQLAAVQQDLRAEYNLGLLYLEGQTNPVDYSKGLHWLTDAAFKGNVHSQYALATLYERGIVDEQGNQLIQADPEQSLAMYYLAASNQWGPAQYRLADYLVMHPQSGLNVAAKKQERDLIEKLYMGAVKDGVGEARLPLAFYHAMDASPSQQQHAFSTAKAEAADGNPQAALLVGMMLERGVGTAKNPIEALGWYQKAENNPANAFILGTYYSQGQGVPKDEDRAKMLLTKAANAGFSYAYHNLAILKHSSGQEFLPALKQAKQMGNSTAGLLLADYYLAQGTDQQNIQQAKEIYQDFADQGDRYAQFKLGYLYEQGLGIPVNQALAAKWYGLAADQGLPTAQFSLGLLYHLAKLEKLPNYELAKKWYQAAQTKEPCAALALGFIYDTVEDNYPKARESYALAAKQGDDIGYFNLGLIYEQGKGIPVDYAQARELYQKSSELGHKQSMTQLGGLYVEGLGGPSDQQQAAVLYKKAAALGDSEAANRLGALSEAGNGISLDYHQAAQYYKKAAKEGNDDAKLALARLYQYGFGVKKNVKKAMMLYTELTGHDNAEAEFQLALFHLNRLLDEKNAKEDGLRLLKKAYAGGHAEAAQMLKMLEASAKTKQKFNLIEQMLMRYIPAVDNEHKGFINREGIEETCAAFSYVSPPPSSTSNEQNQKNEAE